MPDDNIPDSGQITWPIGSGSPTAITLTNIEAQNNNTPILIAAAAAILLVLSGGAVLVYKRSRV